MRKLIALLGTLVLLGIATPAQATEPATVGWWYEPQQIPSIVPVAVPAPLYVQSGQLLVEGTTAGADAVAAVDILLPADSAPEVLTVPVVSTRGTAAVEVCKTLTGWSAAAAGDWDNRPVCDGKAVTMKVSADGKSLSADVSKLGKEGVLDVLLEPATDALTGASETTSVTLATPTVAALTTSPLPVSTTSPAPVPTSAPATTAPTTDPVVVLPPVAPVLPGVVPPSAAASAAPSLAPTVAPTDVTSPQPQVQALKPRAFSTTKGRTSALLLLIPTALLAFLLTRGRERTTIRGVGRYRTERAGTPPVQL